LNVSSGTIDQQSEPQVIMDSAGLWWAPSFVTNGTLAEGPEMMYYDGYYYLFFAAGRYDDYSYTEGVARAKSPFGPFEKMMVPLLSTGIVGYNDGKKLQGPGHGALVSVPLTALSSVTSSSTTRIRQGPSACAPPTSWSSISSTVGPPSSRRRTSSKQ
jgi:beta-xylosidase